MGGGQERTTEPPALSSCSAAPCSSDDRPCRTPGSSSELSMALMLCGFVSRTQPVTFDVALEERMLPAWLHPRGVLVFGSQKRARAGRRPGAAPAAMLAAAIFVLGMASPVPLSCRPSPPPARSYALPPSDCPRAHLHRAEIQCARGECGVPERAPPLRRRWHCPAGCRTWSLTIRRARG